RDTLLNRAAWIDGMGLAVKSATIFPGNPEQGVPMINGAVNLYSDADGTLEALVDFHLVTKWKTAGDSLYAATRLARPDSEAILIIGAGTVGRALWQAYSAVFPQARFSVWNRTRANADAMAAECEGMTVAEDLETAVRAADIVTSATMSTDPLIKGDWLRPGQHIDLIGAYRPDMREADDVAIARARVFVDSFDTTVAHIGEIKTPLETGVIPRDHLIADFYDPERFRRQSPEDITLFKNGGGAHLDLMTSRYILDAWRAAA
ncbi:MAG: ornithine cyclodeaminase, partial [Roseovarius sp.]|nr:ornithine cyclodeaminase [Roseovarius sp.]